MNQTFKQHKQHVENHFKFSRCASVFKLAKLKCKRQHIRRLKSDRSPKRKLKLKKTHDKSSDQTTQTNFLQSACCMCCFLENLLYFKTEKSNAPPETCCCAALQCTTYMFHDAIFFKRTTALSILIYLNVTRD